MSEAPEPRDPLVVQALQLARSAQEHGPGEMQLMPLTNQEWDLWTTFAREMEMSVGTAVRLAALSGLVNHFQKSGDAVRLLLAEALMQNIGEAAGLDVLSAEEYHRRHGGV